MASVIPTPIKTWNFVTNQSYTTSSVAITDAKNMVLTIVNQLVTWGWTVSGSGSTNYGSGARDGTNRWRTTADIVANAWIELHNSTMGCYLVIKNDPSNVADITWLGSYLGFSGGTPSATVSGTATDSFFCNYANAQSYPFGNVAFSCKWHGWQSTDGYVNRIVVYVNSVPVFALHMEKPTAPVSGFPSCVMGVIDQSGTNNMLSVSIWFSGSGGWWTYFAGARRAIYGALPYAGAAGGSAGALQAQTTVNPVDGNWVISNVGACGGNVALFQGLHFWFADLWSVATSLQEGSAMPATGARQVVVCGDFLLPWPDVAMQVV